MEIKKTTCPLDCPDACGIDVYIEDGKIKKLKGDKEHAFTNGFLCQKVGNYYHKRIHSPDRVLYPLLRKGPKGSGEFTRVSWEEAIERISEKLLSLQEEFGGESILPYYYAGNMGQLNFNAGNGFFNKLGASKLKLTICSEAAKIAWNCHYGPYPTTSPHVAVDSELIIAWGINIKVTNIHFWPKVLEAKKKGAKLIVIDPYKNQTGKMADIYIPISPGGDASLAIGIIKVLHEQKKLDYDFIQKFGKGFEEFEFYFTQLTFSEIEKSSGLKEEKIRELSALLAKHPKLFIRIGVGLTRNTTGAMSVRSITCLAAALGLFNGNDGKGALLFSSYFKGSAEILEKNSFRKSGSRTINMVQLGNALNLEKNPIKALFVFSSNPLSVAPDASLVRKGLRREDLFTVVHEQVMTPTARYADLLLPATTSFENYDLFKGYGHNLIGRTEPVIPPVGESLSNFSLFQKLAQKMGFEEEYFHQTEKERLDLFEKSLKGLSEEVRVRGMVYGEYYEAEKVEIGGDFNRIKNARFIFSNSKVEPSFPKILNKKEFEDQSLSKKFPYQMITPPNSKLLNSTFGERYLEKKGVILVHPDDAQEKGFEDGQEIKIFNSRGFHKRIVKISDDTSRGVVICEGIYWEDNFSEGTGINDLTSQALTDLGEGGTFHESRVQLAALEEER